jgi:outer membrane PBP1 activator LpoA protein
MCYSTTKEQCRNPHQGSVEDLLQLPIGRAKVDLAAEATDAWNRLRCAVYISAESHQIRQLPGCILAMPHMIKSIPELASSSGSSCTAPPAK